MADTIGYLKIMISADATQALDQIKAVRQAMDSIKSVVGKSLNVGGGLNFSNIEKQLSNIGNAAPGIKNAQKSIWEMDGSTKDLASNMAKFGLNVRDAFRDTGKYSSNMRDAFADIDMGTKTVKEKAVGLSKGLQAIRNDFIGLQYVGRMTFAAIAGSIAVSVNAAAQFSWQMAEAGSQLDTANKSWIPTFSAGVLDMSVKFGQATKEIASGLYDIISTSIEASQTMKLLEAAAVGATAGYTSIKISTSAMLSLIKAYNLEVSDSAKINDLLFNIVKRGRVTYEQLASGIGMVTGMAATAGLSMTELGAAISTATRVGLPLEQTLTGVRQVVNSFIGASDSAQATAQKLGFELTTAGLAGEGLSKIMEKLRNASQNEIKAMFPNIRARQLLYTLLRDTTGLMEDVNYWMVKSGSAMEAFAEATKEPQYQLNQLKQSFNVFLVAIGEIFTKSNAFGGVLSSLTGFVKNIAAGISGLSQEIKTGIAYFAMFLAAAAGLTSIVGIIAMLSMAIGALGPVLGTIIGVLAGVATAFTVFSTKSKTALAEVKREMDSSITAIRQYREQKSSLEQLTYQYDELKSKISDTQTSTEDRTKAEEELKRVISEILVIVPNAASKWDTYGKAIDISKQKVAEFTEQQKRMLKLNLDISEQKIQSQASGLKDWAEKEKVYYQNAIVNLEFFEKQLEVISAKIREVGAENAKSTPWVFKGAPRQSSPNTMFKTFVPNLDVSYETLAGKLELDDALEMVKKAITEQSAIIAKGADNFELYTSIVNERVMLTAEKIAVLKSEGSPVEPAIEGFKRFAVAIGMNEKEIASLVEQLTSAAEKAEYFSSEIARAIMTPLEGAKPFDIEEYLGSFGDTKEKAIDYAAAIEKVKGEIEDLEVAARAGAMELERLKGEKQTSEVSSQIQKQSEALAVIERQLQESYNRQQELSEKNTQLTIESTINAFKVTGEKAVLMGQQTYADLAAIAEQNAAAAKLKGKTAEREYKEWLSVQKEMTKKNTEEISRAYEERFDRYSGALGFSTETVIALLDKELNAYKHSDEEIVALLNRRRDLLKKQADEYAQIAGDVNKTIKDSFTGGLANIFKGEGFDISSIGDKIGDAFADGFAKAAMKKSGFDALFKGNMLNLGNLVTGLGNTIGNVFGAAKNIVSGDFFSGIFGSAKGAKSAVTSVGSAATKAAPAIAGIGATAASSTATIAAYTSAVPGMTTAISGAGAMAANAAPAIATLGQSSMAGAMGLGGLASKASLAAGGVAKATGAAAAGTTGFGAFAASLAAVAPYAIAAAGALFVASKIIAGNRHISFEETYGKQIRAYQKYLDGRTEAQKNATTKLEAMVDEENKNLLEKENEWRRKRGLEEKKYIDTQNDLWSKSAEERKALLKKMADAGEIPVEELHDYEVMIERNAIRQSTIYQELYNRLANYSNDYWSNEESMLNKNILYRKKYYEDLVKSGLYTAEQLKKIRDALQIYDTEAERKEAAKRTATEAGYQTFIDNFWKVFNKHQSMLNDVEGSWGAWQKAQDEYLKNGGDMLEIYKRKLAEIGITGGQAFEYLMQVARETIGSDDYLSYGKTGTATFMDWAQAIGQSIARAKGDVGEGLSDMHTIINNFLAKEKPTNVFDRVIDISNLRSSLMEIPGITKEMAAKISESLESIWGEVTEISPGMWDEFNKNVRNAYSNPDLPLVTPDSDYVVASYYTAGQNAGEQYRQGLVAGASGSGVPSDALLDESGFASMTSKFSEWGAKYGVAYKGGFDSNAGNLGMDVIPGGPGNKNKSSGSGLISDLVRVGDSFSNSLGEKVGRIFEKISPNMANLETYFNDLDKNGQGLQNLTQQQADALLNLIGVESTATSQQALMGQTSMDTANALFQLLGIGGQIGAEFSNIPGILQMVGKEASQFTLSDKVGELDWDNYIRDLLLGKYVTPVDLNNEVQSVDLRNYVSKLDWKEKISLWSTRDWASRINGVDLDDYISGSIPGAQWGKVYAGKRTMLVGERGPELVRLPQGARVIPNHMIEGFADDRGMDRMGGNGVNIRKIDIRTGDIRTDTDYEIISEKLARSIKNAMKTAQV